MLQAQFNETGTWQGSNPDLVSIVTYQYHETIDQTPISANTTRWTTYRWKFRVRWVWMPLIAEWRESTISGFCDTMYRESPLNTEFGFLGMRIGSYRHGQRKTDTGMLTVDGRNYPADNEIEGTKSTEVLARSMTASFESEAVTTQRNGQQNAATIPGSESVSCRYSDNGVSWSASRLYMSFDGTNSAPPVHAYNSDFWPGSGGYGSATLTPLVLPPNSPRYSLYYGLPFLNPDTGAGFYGFQAFFDPTWWQRTPF